MPTNGRFVVDTNVVIALFACDPAIRERIATAAEVFIPTPVLGELYYGAIRSSRAAANIAQIDLLPKNYAILPVDHTTAKFFGELRNDLRKIGKPIPTNDIWVAALAAQWSATVATRDEHFNMISNVRSEQW